MGLIIFNSAPPTENEIKSQTKQICYWITFLLALLRYSIKYIFLAEICGKPICPSFHPSWAWLSSIPKIGTLQWGLIFFHFLLVILLKNETVAIAHCRCRRLLPNLLIVWWCVFLEYIIWRHKSLWGIASYFFDAKSLEFYLFAII